MRFDRKEASRHPVAILEGTLAVYRCGVTSEREAGSGYRLSVDETSERFHQRHDQIFSTRVVKLKADWSHPINNQQSLVHRHLKLNTSTTRANEKSTPFDRATLTRQYHHHHAPSPPLHPPAPLLDSTSNHLQPLYAHAMWSPYRLMGRSSPGGVDVADHARRTSLLSR
jgi:hypothetical protein